MTRSIFVFTFLVFALLESHDVFAQQSQNPQPAPGATPARRYYRPAQPGAQPTAQPGQAQQLRPPTAPRRVVTRPTPPPAPKVQIAQKPMLSLAPTHILPSAFVLPSGSFIIGTTTASGIGGFMDISTNLYNDIEQVYNVMVKFGVIKGRNVALSLWAEYTNQTEQYNGSDPTTGLPAILTTSFSSIDPGVTFSYRLGRRFTGHTGGNYALQNPVITKASLSQRTSYIQGNTLHQEFTMSLSDDLALSLGGSYDATYDVWGAGFSFHLDALQLGAHYYFNVSQGSILPIIGGSFPLNF